MTLSPEQIDRVVSKCIIATEVLSSIRPNEIKTLGDQAKAYSTIVEFIKTLDSFDGGTAVLEQLLNFISNQEKE